MKKKFVFIALIAAGMFVFGNEAKAQFVSIRPTLVVRDAPPRPSPRHVWIAPEWTWRNGRYEQGEGHWENERRGHRYHEGHWSRNRRKGGYIWISGRWS